MMVMPGDYDAPVIFMWVGKYPGKIGWVISPSARRKNKIPKWMPFVCDNDAFIAWSNNKPWNEDAYFKMLDDLKRRRLQPKWVLAPDVVADRQKTIDNWKRYAPRIKPYGWSLFFACQDGMTPADVPADADGVFIGGTSEWKWRNVERFCQERKRVHVGRVNTLERVWRCHDLGAESVDGTGWFRDGQDNWRLEQLEEYFEGRRPQLDLFT